jgi:hypothetical protein
MWYRFQASYRKITYCDITTAIISLLDQQLSSNSLYIQKFIRLYNELYRVVNKALNLIYTDLRWKGNIAQILAGESSGALTFQIWNVNARNGTITDAVVSRAFAFDHSFTYYQRGVIQNRKTRNKTLLHHSFRSFFLYILFWVTSMFGLRCELIVRRLVELISIT